MISFKTPELPTRALRAFFDHLPYVLPCKYCRASLTDYFFADPMPIRGIVADATADATAEWMYRIHNRVNGKLREQKLLETPNPSWPTVRKRYTDWLAAPCTERRMTGWDFLFSVANTTPGLVTHSTPMPGAPPTASIPTPALRNRWNVMTAEERLPFLATWWAILPAVLPFATWRAAWAAAQKREGPAPLRKGRKAMVAWLYAMECATCRELKEAVPHGSFEGLCSELATFTSGCGKSKRSKTCRATKARRRRATARLRERRLHHVVHHGGGGYGGIL